MTLCGVSWSRDSVLSCWVYSTPLFPQVCAGCCPVSQKAIEPDPRRSQGGDAITLLLHLFVAFLRLPGMKFVDEWSDWVQERDQDLTAKLVTGEAQEFGAVTKSGVGSRCIAIDRK